MPASIVDDYAGSSVGYRCAMLLAAHDFDAVRAAIESCGWSEAAHIVAGLARQEDLWRAADQWPAERPGDAIGITLAATCTIERAWSARGQGPADDVAPEQFLRYIHLLRQAEQQLEQAWRADRTMPLSWCTMLRSGTALQVSPQEQRLRFDQARPRMADSLVLHMYFAEAISPRWRGEEADLFAFAREATSAAPDGSPLHAITVIALVEKALAASDTDGLDLESSAIEIRQAGNRSVQHPAFAAHAGGPDGALARNWFMLGYDLAGDGTLAKRQRDAIGNRPTRQPWSFARDAAGAFDTASHRRH